MSLLRRATPIALLAAASCSDIQSPLDPTPETRSYPGFDTSIYPGDAAMRAWLNPGSPYEWVGYYLPAPCHRDITWSGKRPALTAMGWGLAVIYVGQQTFEGIPAISVAPQAYATRSIARATINEDRTIEPTCSRTLLTRAQGITDANDAIAKTLLEGFPAGTTIFLDIEYMTTIPASMEAYYRAWVERVLADGKFRPGIYAHRFNALSIYAGASEAYRAAGSVSQPAFWIASTAGFALGKHPTDTGFDFAVAWQGILDTPQTWNGHTINIDVNVASSRSPSAP
ncbi:MAG: DUF1906 domain-containing protein [Gemmatimonadaceae bacterium]|nr:DUF1906 domain-containing protein [Gemmatimonadaceae bacterium]